MCTSLSFSIISQMCFICMTHIYWNMVPDLTQGCRETHICVSKLTIIGSDNGLSPGRRKAIIWTHAGLLLIVPLGTNFSELLIKIYTFSFKKMHLKMSSGKWQPFCLGLMCSVNTIYTIQADVPLDAMLQVHLELHLSVIFSAQIFSAQIFSAQIDIRRVIANFCVMPVINY